MCLSIKYVLSFLQHKKKNVQTQCGPSLPVSANHLKQVEKRNFDIIGACEQCASFCHLILKSSLCYTMNFRQISGCVNRTVLSCAILNRESRHKPYHGFYAHRRCIFYYTLNETVEKLYTHCTHDMNQRPWQGRTKTGNSHKGAMLRCYPSVTVFFFFFLSSSVFTTVSSSCHVFRSPA